MTNILKQAPLFTTEASNTNCRLIRLNFLPSIRVSTLKSAKLKRIPFPLNLIGKHESMESRGSFTISWFIILNKNGCNMQMIMFYSNICMNSNVLKLLLKYLIENYKTVLIIIFFDFISSSKSYCDVRFTLINTIYFCIFKPANGKIWYRERKWKMWRQRDHAMQEYLI